MFFSNDLLTKRHRSGWSLYWLAAVSANFKSAVTRLSKKDLLNANLPEACSTLSQPPEPLALRLSSALLLGIVRVYGHIIATAQHSRSRSRSQVVIDGAATLNVGTGGNTFARARDQEHIGELFGFEEPDPFLFDPNFHEGEADDLYRGFGAILVGDKPTRISLTASRSDSSSRRRDPFVSKPSEISLSGGSLGLGPFSTHADDPNGLNEYLGPGLDFDDLGGEGGDINLGIIPETNVDPVVEGQRIRQPSSRFGIESEVGRAYQGRHRHTSIMGIPMSPAGTQRTAENVRESRLPEGPEQYFEFEPTSQFINPELSLHDGEEQLDTLGPESLEKLLSLKRKDESQPRLDRRKFIKVLVDPVTSLSAENVMNMRQHYRIERLERENKYQNRRLQQLMQARAKDLVYGIPPYFQASNLRELWSDCVKVPEATRQAVDRPPEEYQGADRNVELELPSSHSDQTDHRYAGPGAGGPLQGSEVHDESFFNPLENIPWQNFEQNRNQIEPFLGEEQERIEEIEEDVMGRQRAPSYESSTHRLSSSQVLPWNRQGLLAAGAAEGGYESDYGALDSYGMDAGDASGRRSSQVRRETPVHLRRRSSLLSSREPTRISSTSQQIRSSLIPRNIEQIQQIETDPDALNFLAWSQSRIDDPSDFLFSDLAPVASTSSPIAAQAFIKVLSLASQDLIEVIEQDEAYGEIRLKILAPGP
ncbi:hypothetical protein PGTUg99_015547 [Puccinia graminis f. sp. tritici]|uniref:Rad21/Rec8-like protein N-terminal domain-containing protein n=1 Tax=Puccinia graminis f. sp. tritici TaxID=56615 RepID=A0A5B0MSJ4_PUCGR|nr:hypothetical protein PGTUg99_015547 [Puccinia graminis f. sp. tritici]